VDGIEDVTAAVAHVPGLGAGAPVALGGEHELVALALEPASEDVLGRAGKVGAAAKRIDVGGVDEGDAALGGPIQDRTRGRFVDLEAESHRPEAQPRNFQTRAAEPCVLDGDFGLSAVRVLDTLGIAMPAAPKIASMRLGDVDL